SVLLFAPNQQQVVGLIEQKRGVRNINDYGKKKQRETRPYQEKKSAKWEAASRAMAARLGPEMTKVISVCDRESDVIEYLAYKVMNQQRFVVRSMQSRRIAESEETLYTFSDTLQSAGERQVQVRQRGGRKAREALCEIRYAPVTIKMPMRKQGKSVPLYYVGCQEINPDSPLCWHLLTSKPVNNQEDAKRILDYYEKRGLIEEFHKAWKSGGTQVEELRMQSKDNLEKMIVIQAFIAVRVHQLRYPGLNRQEAEQQSCETLLSPLAGKLLWRKVEKKKLPGKVPSVHWAYITLGKLAGWQDSKRNGRVGWEALWEGWFLVQVLIEGHLIAKSLGF
ncbi:MULTISPECIES: IS4 family transposase, partial [unclassified Photorhabdus]